MSPMSFPPFLPTMGALVPSRLPPLPPMPPTMLQPLTAATAAPLPPSLPRHPMTMLPAMIPSLPHRLQYFYPGLPSNIDHQKLLAAIAAQVPLTSTASDCVDTLHKVD